MPLRDQSIRLHTRRPSPTTTLYSVTNTPDRPTRLSSLPHYLRLSLRAALALFFLASALVLLREVITSEDQLEHGWQRHIHAWARQNGITNTSKSLYILVVAFLAMAWIFQKRDNLRMCWLCVIAPASLLTTFSEVQKNLCY